MDKTHLFHEWGFESYPFATWSTEQEKGVSVPFIAPPYFSEVVGPPGAALSSLVYGHRGTGKTRLCERVALALAGMGQQRPLVVLYADFSAWDGRGVDAVTLEQHLERIVAAAVAELVREGKQDPSIIARLRKEDRSLLHWFILRFLPGPNYHHIEAQYLSLCDGLAKGPRLKRAGAKAFGRVMSLARRKRVEIESLAATSHPVVQAVARAVVLVLPSVPSAGDLRGETMVRLLERLVGLVRAAGFPSLCVLVDKVDEAAVVASKPELAARLIRPLATSQQYLDCDGVATKLFLPAEVVSHLQGDLRTDRLSPTRVIEWSRPHLEEVLRRRLLASSGQEIDTLRPYFTEEAWEEFSEGIFRHATSPRDLLRVVDHVIGEHCQLSECAAAVSQAAVRMGLAHFFEVRVTEGDGDEYARIVRARSQGGAEQTG